MRFALAAVALAAWVATARSQTPDCSVAPGFQQEGPAREYNTETLFEYMDGNSEGYFAYGFVRMRGITCAKGEDKLIIDISEMADAESAYGMFGSTRDVNQKDVRLGMGGQIVPRKAVFAKGKYYVEAAAEPEKDHTTLLNAVARELEKRTPGDTRIPEAISWFATDGLVGGAARLVPQSVLGLRILKRGYVGQYASGSKAFVLPEASPQDAAGVIAKLKERLALSDSAGFGEESYRTTDKYLGKLCVFRKGRFVGGYANVPEGEDAVKQARSLFERIP